ncbi:MBL fold metallo-hydrolase [Rapidithrix thailandica]|uniref:MBL fold metallo-hydrolase n=1 Tax=Rapidithrix thailandica TaxID=413964 RepID=A0AAW9S825_9BACT
MKLTFWGACRQVTGSMFHLELEDGYTLLIDCGMDMENAQEPQPHYPGSTFPFDASRVNTVLLTHAHIDHSGKIPNLLREDFEGQVYCTPPTLALAELLLKDSASIHAKKLKTYHKNKYKSGKKKVEGNPAEWYVDKHVNDSLRQFQGVDFNRKIKITPQLYATFIPTGHLLGAANILLEVEENGTWKKLLFSGDIGRNHYPLLSNPQTPPQVDYLICESTYGNRQHKSTDQSEEELEKVIQQACVETPGRLIIPAFSVGRTQAILYTLNKLYLQNRLPFIKIFADSPMAYQSNRIYERYASFLNPESQAFKEQHQSLFNFDNLSYIEKTKDSRALSGYNAPCIIISASGMLEGGRIQHHIKSNINNPNCTILMVGYVAEGTFGHDLLHKLKSLKVGSKEIPIAATIRQTDVFSGHGDLQDLLSFVGQQSPGTLQKLFLVHGEERSIQDFQQTLSEKGYQQIEVPERGQSFEL